jgi:hypothetical protein
MYQLRRRLKPFALLAVGILVLVQIVALLPSSVDEGNSTTAPIDPEALIDDAGADQITLATGIPRGKIPEYTVDGFGYSSIQDGQKQWKLDATRAHFFSKDQVVHARRIKALLYDPDGKITEVTGLEAKYSMSATLRDLEIFGNVKTTFPDGFQIFSEYLRYMPQTRTIEITRDQPVAGNGLTQDRKQRLSFTSLGLEFEMAKSEIVLPKAARVKLDELVHDPENKGTREETVIESDRCVIDRKVQIARFTMDPLRALGERFVHITQPKLFAKSRRADLNYGDFSELIHYMTAFEDVLIRDLSAEKDAEKQARKSAVPLQYATAGRADFEKRRDIVVLTELPQVYQDADTVTGDIIILHRDTNIVEVENSNSFTGGGAGNGGTSPESPEAKP